MQALFTDNFYTTCQLFCDWLLAIFLFLLVTVRVFYCSSFRAADMFGCKNQVVVTFTSAWGFMQTPFRMPCELSVWSRHQFFDTCRVFIYLCGTNNPTLFPDDLDFRLRNKNKTGYRDLVKTGIQSLFGRRLEAPAGQKVWLDM